MLLIAAGPNIDDALDALPDALRTPSAAFCAALDPNNAVICAVACPKPSPIIAAILTPLKQGIVAMLSAVDT